MHTFAKPYTRKIAALALLVLATRVAAGGVSAVPSSVSKKAFHFVTVEARNLENNLGGGDSDAVKAFLSQDSSQKEDKEENKNGYNPYKNGTSVRFQDIDGTWMDGVIINFDESSHTYTVQWDEDNVQEKFSNLAKIDELVVNFRNKVGEGDDDGDNVDNEWNDTGNDDGTSNRGFDYTYTPESLAQYEPWPIGTPTLLEFTDGTFGGTITSYSLSDDQRNATYLVTWSDGTKDTFNNELEWIDVMVESAKMYAPWNIGTPVYGKPDSASDGPNLDGQITNFDGAYSVRWSNGDVTQYSNLDRVDELVNNAMMLDQDFLDGYEPWPIGTPVTGIFDSGWWNGTITNFADGKYEVTWSDGLVKYYSSMDKIDEMVAFSQGAGFGDDPQYDDFMHGDDEFYTYPIGTLVYAQFKDGWWAGYIDDMEKRDDGDYYIVTWSDETTDSFAPGPDLDEMVNNAQYIQNDFEIYPEGTQVYARFNGSWFRGTIDFSAAGYHEIIWEDGERTVKMAGDQLDQMVSNAYARSGSSRSSFFATVFIVVVVAGIVVAGLFFVKKRGNRRRRLAEVTEQVRENELDLTENPRTRYSDEAQPAVV